MRQYRSHRLLHTLSLLAIIAGASSCTSPDSYKYKMSPHSPATSSLWDSYTDPLPGFWSDTKALFKSGMETNFTLMGPPKASAVREKHEETNFKRYTPVYLKVYKVSVVEDYQSPRREPNVEHLLAISPTDAVQSWSNRLRSSGGIYHMEVVIRNASVVSSPAQDGNAENPNRRYDATLDIELRIYNRSGVLTASVGTVANRSAMIREQTGADERRDIFRRMMFDLMDMANSQLEQKMFKHFTAYIDYSKSA